jgi:pilus assembly protein Flp/PilA
MMNVIKNFLRDESGAAAVEYGMLVALIAAVIVTTVALLGTDIKSAYHGAGRRAHDLTRAATAAVAAHGAGPATLETARYRMTSLYQEENSQ